MMATTISRIFMVPPERLADRSHTSAASMLTASTTEQKPCRAEVRIRAESLQQQILPPENRKGIYVSVDPLGFLLSGRDERI